MAAPILVPTDFSEGATNAMKVAVRLAQKRACPIQILHVYHPSVDLSNPQFDILQDTFGNVKDELLELFIAKFKDAGVAIDTQVCVGLPAQEIVRASKEAQLVVMGTTGAGGVMERLFGSVSSTTARKAHCPTLLVPEHYSADTLDRVLFASDYTAADQQVMKQLADLIRMDRGTLHFLHVQEEKAAAYELLEQAYEQMLPDQLSEIGFTVAKVKCASVVQGICDYAEQHDVSLIALSTVHRSLIDDFFHKSITHRLVFLSKVPLLIFHYDD
jgi:nucleotide-binding universal stress UspA family protein